MSDTAIMDKQAIAQLLTSTLHAEDSDTAISAAVRQLSEQATASGSAIGDFVWDAYNAILDVVAQPWARQQQLRMVELVVQLRQAPPVLDRNGQPRRYEGGRVWTDMPAFGWLARDLWNFDVLQPDFPDEDMVKLERQSAFLARLTVASDVGDPKDPFNFSLFALWSLRTAFEEIQEGGTDVANAVRLAIPWATAASGTLWKLSRDGKQFEANVGAGGARCSDKQWKGFNTERWELWKEGFATAVHQHKDTELGTDAGIALTLMKEASV